MALKVYLAAPWVDRENMPEYAAKVEEAGVEITHKWWDVASVADDEEKLEADVLRQQGQWDVAGVTNADILILFNTKKSEGKATEQGIAIALNKPIIAIGKLGQFSKNVFHHLPNYHWVGNLDEAIKVLRTLKWLLKQ